MDYEEYEIKVKEEREMNETLLDEFREYLKSSGLKPKTIKRHISNINFYINEYLLYEDINSAEDGVYRIDMYLGYWFIKKAMWASVGTIRTNAASLKKFYKFMYENEYTSKEELEYMEKDIKDNLETWIKKMKRYDNLNVENPWSESGLYDY